MENEIKTALWTKVSEKGNTYYSGKVNIGGVDYYMTMFVNNMKRAEKHPDFNIMFKPASTQPKSVVDDSYMEHISSQDRGGMPF